MGKQEGENGHDVIEELAKMDWQVTYPRFSTCCSLTSVQNVRAMVAINITWENCPYPDTASIPESDYSNLMIYFGPTGILRASHSKTDPARAIHPQYPFHTHDEVQKITPGTVVELEIGLWAMGMDFEEGESLSVQVSGEYPLVDEFKGRGPKKPQVEERNKGLHHIHLGGEYASPVILPFVREHQAVELLTYRYLLAIDSYS